MACRNDYRPWTPEEDAELKALLGQEMSNRAIAKQLGRPESSVHARATVIDKQRMTRSCMCCKKIFRSEGPHNRLCGTCRRKETTPFHY